MALLTVNGVELPDPSDLKVNISDLSSEESGRLQNGEMVKDLVARKIQIDVSWNTLTWEQTSIILSSVEQSIFLTVVYPDPKVGSYQTKTFYVGDRSAPAVWLANGKEYWGGVSFTFIEK